MSQLLPMIIVLRRAIRKCWCWSICTSSLSHVKLVIGTNIEPCCLLCHRSIQSCGFTGNIPDSLGNLTNLTFMWVIWTYLFEALTLPQVSNFQWRNLLIFAWRELDMIFKCLLLLELFVAINIVILTWLDLISKISGIDNRELPDVFYCLHFYCIIFFHSMLVIVTNDSAIYATHMFPTYSNQIFHECYLNSLLGVFRKFTLRFMI